MTGPAPQDPRRSAGLPATGPLSIGQVVELSVAALSRRWSTALVLAVLFVAPGAIAVTAFRSRFDSIALDVLPPSLDGVLDGSVLLTAIEVERLMGAVVAYLGATLVAGLLGSVGAVAFSRLLAADLGIGRGDLGEALRVALRRAPSVIAFGLVTSVIIVAIGIAALLAVLAVLTLAPAPSVAQGGLGVFAALVIGVALVVAVVYLTLRWAPAFAVMAFEDAGWRRSLARSWELSAERIWRILAVVLLGTVVSVLLSVVVAQLLAVVVVDWATPTFGLDPVVGEALVVAVGSIVVAPITPLLVAALYVDLRRRRQEVVASAATAEAEPHADEA